MQTSPHPYGSSFRYPSPTPRRDTGTTPRSARSTGSKDKTPRSARTKGAWMGEPMRLELKGSASRVTHTPRSSLGSPGSPQHQTWSFRSEASSSTSPLQPKGSMRQFTQQFFMSARRRPCDNNFLWHPEEFFSLRQKWADQQEERVERGIFFNKYGELIDQAVSAVMDQVAYKLVYGEATEIGMIQVVVDEINRKNLSQMLEDFGAEEKVKREAQKAAKNEEAEKAARREELKKERERKKKEQDKKKKAEMAREKEVAGMSDFQRAELNL